MCIQNTYFLNFLIGVKLLLSILSGYSILLDELLLFFLVLNDPRVNITFFFPFNKPFLIKCKNTVDNICEQRNKCKAKNKQTLQCILQRTNK